MAATATVLVAGAAGCSVSVGGLDVAKLQDQIGTDLKKLTPEQEVTVSCPQSVSASAGATFDCTATVGGQTVTYVVTQTDGDGNVTYTRQEALMDLDTLERTVRTQLQEQVQGNWAVECGDKRSRLLAEEPGATFVCKASDGSELVPVTVTVKDVEGNITWKAS